jgi:hypothetical protein
MGKYSNLPVVSPERGRAIQRTQKTCSTCGVTKLIEEFHKRKGTPDGRTYYCKECHHNTQKRYYYANRDKQVQKAMAWNKAHRDRFLGNLARYQNKPEIREKRADLDAGYQRAYRLRKKNKILRGAFTLREPHQKILDYLSARTVTYTLSNTIAQELSLNLDYSKQLLKELRLGGYLESAHTRGYKLKQKDTTNKEVNAI